MELKAKFDVIYIEEAIAFLESLSEKATDKIAYISQRAGIKDLFKKLSNDIWDSELYTCGAAIVCLSSGIRIQGIL